jgi:hypothetical protein
MVKIQIAFGETRHCATFQQQKETFFITGANLMTFDITATMPAL